MAAGDAPMRDEEGNELRVYRPKSYGTVVREVDDLAPSLPLVEDDPPSSVRSVPT